KCRASSISAAGVHWWSLGLEPTLGFLPLIKRSGLCSQFEYDSKVGGSPGTFSPILAYIPVANEDVLPRTSVEQRSRLNLSSPTRFGRSGAHRTKCTQTLKTANADTDEGE